MKFFWVIVTCHAEWTDCQFDPQPTQGICMGQAEQINVNTDAIAVCTTRPDTPFGINAPAEWAITDEAPNDR